MGTGRTDEFRKEAVRITTVVANALRTTTRKLRTATACSRPWVARATAMTVNMVSQLDGLTHVTIDFVSLR
jgi:hypothetical protein